MHLLHRSSLVVLGLLLFLNTTVTSSASVGEEHEFSRTEVSFESESIRLAATLLLPDKEGPLPAVVLVHGSGSSSRSNPWTTAYAEALARRGLAVLHPDKRGSGASEGSWRNASFEILAEDAIAGAEFLGGRPEVDTTQIGLVGFSQGGHIVPVAAARSDRVAFVIDISGSTVPIREQIIDEVDLIARRAGLSDRKRRAVNQVHRLLIEFGLTGEGWEEYRTAREELLADSDSVTASIVREFPDRREHWIFEFARVVGDFDPLPYWRAVSVPALFVYGGQDENVKIHKSIDRVQRELTDELDYTLALFSENGHAIYREDLLDLIARWIVTGNA